MACFGRMGLGFPLQSLGTWDRHLMLLGDVFVYVVYMYHLLIQADGHLKH